jgi:hypothetical protein
MKIRRERVSAAPAQACSPQRSSRVDRDSPAFGAQRQRNFRLPGSRLLASVKVRDQVSHPLRRDSGRSINRNCHLSPSVNTSRLPITELLAMIPTRGRLTKWTALLSGALGEQQCFGERAEDLLITDLRK